MSSHQEQSKKQVQLCGVTIDSLSTDAVVARVASAMQGGGQEQDFLQIATVNPDFLLKARRDTRFKSVLDASELRLADGVGITVVARLLGQRVLRYPGADLFFDLLAIAEREGWHTHFFCWDGGLSRWADVQLALAARYPCLHATGEDVSREKCLHFCHAREGGNPDLLKKLAETNNDLDPGQSCSQPLVSLVGDQSSQDDIREKIPTECLCAQECICVDACACADASVQPGNCAVTQTENQPMLYIINLGMLWQEECAAALRAAGAKGVAIGVGGALDFLTGAVPRAPRWMQHMGLEWVWRTFMQPKRSGKAFRSVIVFPVVAIVMRLCDQWHCVRSGYKKND